MLVRCDRRKHAQAVVDAGDCLFLPQWHYHHVKSTAGPGGLSAAINLWWKRLEIFDPSSGFGCNDDEHGAPVPVSEVHKRGSLNPNMY
jgi:hypothetical protein